MRRGKARWREEVRWMGKYGGGEVVRECEAGEEVRWRGRYG